jgi:multiple sugar transport system substrate-binding protein
MRHSRSRGLVWAIAAVLLSGCPTTPPSDAQPTSVEPSRAKPLRVAVLDDPQLAQAIERQWQARAEGQIEVVRTTVGEFLDKGRAQPAVDAIFYPSGWIGQLAEGGWISPLSDDAIHGPLSARRDIFELIRQQEVYWGEKVYAVPLGSPQLNVVYRRDVFEKLGLDPPRTWTEYAETARKLAQKARPADRAPAAAWHALAEPLGPGWAGQVLLARAAGYARHRSYYATLFDLETMQPLIATPPFIKALEELVAAAPFSSPDAVKFTPDETRREVLAGRCAMSLTWPARRAETPDAGPSASVRDGGVLAVAELPGSAQVYHPENKKWEPRDRAELGSVPLLAVAGRLGSVAKSSRQPQAAMALVLRVAGAEWSEQISPLSPATTLFRASQLGKVTAWTGDFLEPPAAKEYAELVQQTQSRPLWLCSPRFPGRDRYLAVLDDAVHEAVRGAKPPAECLQAAAERWQTITRELGVPAQRTAYLRSLCMEP